VYAQSINANWISKKNWSKRVMDRAEALAVLDEILEVCKESLIMNSVSLDNPPISAISKGYQIHI
jgi:hypothetical protein